MQIEIIQGIIQGFSTGLGVGIAHWIFIQRLEYWEKKIIKKNINKILKKTIKKRLIK